MKRKINNNSYYMYYNNCNMVREAIHCSPKFKA